MMLIEDKVRLWLYWTGLDTCLADDFTFYIHLNSTRSTSLYFRNPEGLLFILIVLRTFLSFANLWHRCHAHSVSKGVILWNTIPYMLAMQKHSKWAGSASGMQRSKVTKVESSMIEKEATALKYKDFVIALYLTGMHGNKAKEWARLLRDPFCIRESNCSGMRLHAGWG